jgi:hypothetical protein
MGYAALDAIDDAIDATKGFLLPFDRGTWLRLAVIMFFVTGGGAGILNNAGNVPQFAGEGDFGAAPGAGPGTAVPDLAFGAAAIALVLLAVLIGLLLLLASPIMEFVFVESLFEREVHVRQYFSQNVGNGLRLLGFQIAVTIAVVAVFVGLGLVGFLLVGGLDTTTGVVGIVLLALPLLAILAVVTGIVNGFTTVFVVPIMLAEERGVLSAWGRLWGSIKRNVAEYLVYLVMSVLLGIGIGIVGGLGSLFVLAIVGIPFALVAFGVYSLLGFGTAAIAVYAVLGLLFLVVYLLGVGLVQAPLQSFLRYYAMLVLGDVDADLDPIPAIREAVRANDPSTP